MKLNFKKRIPFICFLIILITPAIFMNKNGGNISNAENRMLALKPSLFINNKFNSNFSKEFEVYVNDNIGFREQISKMYTLSCYEIFNISTRNDTRWGKDNWLWYITPAVVDDFRTVTLPTQQELENYTFQMEKLDNLVNNYGGELLTVILPDKKTVYPEYYPSYIKKVNLPTKMEMISDYIQNNTDLQYFTPLGALRNEKNQHLVYSPRIDFAHWNVYGAFVGYKEIMGRIQQKFPQIKILTENDFIIEEYQNEALFYNAIKVSELDYKFTPRYESIVQKVDENIYRDLLNFEPQKSYRYITNDSNLPKILVFGDSYTYSFLLPWYAESCSELIFIHNGNLEKIEEIIKVEQPNIVVIEYVERTVAGINSTLDRLFPVVDETPSE